MRQAIGEFPPGKTGDTGVTAADSHLFVGAVATRYDRTKPSSRATFLPAAVIAAR